MDIKNMIKPKKILSIINFVLLFGLIVSLGVNQVVIAKTNDSLSIGKNTLKGVFSAISKKSSLGSGDIVLNGNITEDAIKLALSQGVPEIYGSEMGVSFDDVQPAIDIMREYDPTYGGQAITLIGNDLKRYINVGLKISCEYCCSAKSIIREDGDAACGCAHSWAMRGLMAYLIQNHGSEYTDDEILRELARWKGMYFPKQMIAKLASQLGGVEFTPDAASLVLGIDLPDYGQGGGDAPLPSDINNLPSMVGGC